MRKVFGGPDLTYWPKGGLSSYLQAVYYKSGYKSMGINFALTAERMLATAIVLELLELLEPLALEETQVGSRYKASQWLAAEERKEISSA